MATQVVYIHLVIVTDLFLIVTVGVTTEDY